MGRFERYLTVWVLLCIVAGVLLGKMAPGVAASLDQLRLDSDFLLDEGRQTGGPRTVVSNHAVLDRDLHGRYASSRRSQSKR